MKKIVIAIIILAFTSRVGLAKNQGPDSLKRLLKNVKQDTSRLMLTEELVSYYTYTKPDSAFKYSNQGLMLAQKIHSPKWDITVFITSGFLQRETGNLPEALELATKALETAKEYNYLNLESKAFTLLGTIYHDLNEPEKAIGYYRESLKIDGPQKNKSGINVDLLNIGSCFIVLNKNDSAKRYLNLAYTGYLAVNRINDNAYAWRNMGRLQFNIGNYPLALAYLKKSIQITLHDEDHRNAAYSYVQVAKLFEKINRPDSVIFYATLSLRHGEVGPYNLFILMADELLAKGYEQKSDFKKALLYTNLTAKSKETLFGADNIRLMQTIVDQEEQNQKEIETAQQAYQSKLRQYGLFSGLIVLLAIVFILYRNNRQKHKANEVLGHTLTELKTTQTQLIQSEKMASLGELTAGIAHEIQNPLNFVNNFSEVNKEMLEELKAESKKPKAERDEQLEIELINDLIENEQKISHHGKRADGIVKGMLEHSRSSAGQKEPTDLNKLVDEYLRLAYHGLRAKDKSFNAEMVTHSDPNLPKVNVSQQDMGRVMLNLFNNAFYAVNQKAKTAGGNYKPEVMVTTSTENGQVVIKVKDNGIGIPDAIKEKIMQPFFTTKPTGEGTGLGLSLTYDMLVKGNGGTIAIDSEEGIFAEFKITLPLAYHN